MRYPTGEHIFEELVFDCRVSFSARVADVDDVAEASKKAFGPAERRKGHLDVSGCLRSMQSTQRDAEQAPQLQANVRGRFDRHLDQIQRCAPASTSFPGCILRPPCRSGVRNREVCAAVTSVSFERLCSLPIARKGMPAASCSSISFRDLWAQTRQDAGMIESPFSNLTGR
jgi:hypothetical protein